MNWFRIIAPHLRLERCRSPVKPGGCLHQTISVVWEKTPLLTKSARWYCTLQCLISPVITPAHNPSIWHPHSLRTFSQRLICSLHCASIKLVTRGQIKCLWHVRTIVEQRSYCVLEPRLSPTGHFYQTLGDFKGVFTGDVWWRVCQGILISKLMMRIVVQMSRKLSFLWGDPCPLQIRPCWDVTITSAGIFLILTDWESIICSAKCPSCSGVMLCVCCEMA